MLIEHTETFGWRAAFRGMRNPLNSWHLSDSIFDLNLLSPILGDQDLKLAKKLILAGNEHAKFTRQIFITFDLTVPIYVWSEFDTYKIGVTRNSCSTMHKLGSRPLIKTDFEDELVSDEQLMLINSLQKEYSETKNFEVVKQMKGHLNSSFLQKATISMNYQVARNIYFQRRNHRLNEWNNKEDNPKFSITKFIESLPYSKELITIEK